MGGEEGSVCGRGGGFSVGGRRVQCGREEGSVCLCVGGEEGSVWEGGGFSVGGEEGSVWEGGGFSVGGEEGSVWEGGGSVYLL